MSGNGPAAALRAALLDNAAVTDEQVSRDPRVADLVHAGEVRFGLFPPQYYKDAKAGRLKGVWVEIACELAARIGVKAVLLEFSTPPAVVKCMNDGKCDIGFLGFDPARAGQVQGFSPPFVRVEYTYLVRKHSAIRSIADTDNRGVRIAAVNNHASTLTLSRMLKHAEMIAADTPNAAFDMLRSGRVDAWASVRPALLDYSAHLPGSRVIEGNFGANLPAVVVAKGQAARLAYISEFIENAKASGLIQQAIDRGGQAGYQMPPPAKSE
jgi:polar amino acid transport system substrate-binding protein